ncbi:sporulation peptidase YabG [Herbivorax sp. ANBcel31]|uniref:sporulation peptidase YabG n=1 Tax=Herbivorax sp. ANBcel31 TaxID=3069754 RepID=UPI0027ADD05F|nr:sporulation peptidase YabG [Herbivorax sp. ANBcel31]MDQ2085183.1 sporulation peptidase YabG [Herbivorax sp. ANBcel31]
MAAFNICDIVVRKSHGKDIYFTIAGFKESELRKPEYILKGLFYRIEADAYEEDLLKEDVRNVQLNLKMEIMRARNNIFRAIYLNRLFGVYRLRKKPGTILQIDSSSRFLNMCTKLYREAGIKSKGYVVAERNQPGVIRQALFQTKPDILVVTGHDGIKKGKSNLSKIENYRNSKYYVRSVKEARRYQKDSDKLCIFAGACQSYFEAIMDAGANFASSPGRININALDPAIVSERVALTDRRYYVVPEEVSKTTISGSKGIGGVNTRGRLVLV